MSAKRETDYFGYSFRDFLSTRSSAFPDLPVLKSGDRIRGVFENSITDEFRNYITMKEGDFHNGSR